MVVEDSLIGLEIQGDIFPTLNKRELILCLLFSGVIGTYCKSSQNPAPDWRGASFINRDFE
jgi:hypothetical protein